MQVPICLAITGGPRGISTAGLVGLQQMRQVFVDQFSDDTGLQRVFPAFVRITPNTTLGKRPTRSARLSFERVEPHFCRDFARHKAVVLGLGYFALDAQRFLALTRAKNTVCVSMYWRVWLSVWSRKNVLFGMFNVFIDFQIKR